MRQQSSALALYFLTEPPSPLLLPHSPRRHLKHLFKQPVKIRDIIKMNPVADFFNRVGRRLQQRISVEHFLFVKIIGDSLANQLFKCAADILLAVGKRANQRLLVHDKILRRGQERQELRNPDWIMALRAELLA